MSIIIIQYNIIYIYNMYDYQCMVFIISMYECTSDQKWWEQVIQLTKLYMHGRPRLHHWIIVGSCGLQYVTVSCLFACWYILIEIRDGNIDRNPRWGTTNFHHSSMPTPRAHVERQNEQFEFNNKPGIAWGWYRGSGQSPFYWIPSLGVLNLDPVDVFNELLELSIGLISHWSICIWGPQSDESYKGLSCGTLI